MLLDLSPAAYGRTIPTHVPNPAVTPAAMPPAPRRAVTDLLDSTENWTWQQLRDYVLRACAERHGPAPVDDIKTSAIFKAFHARWGTLAGPIARFAYQQQDGYWRSAPVTPTRFCKASDDYFAAPIAERLTSAAA